MSRGQFTNQLVVWITFSLPNTIDQNQSIMWGLRNRHQQEHRILILAGDQQELPRLCGGYVVLNLRMLQQSRRIRLLPRAFINYAITEQQQEI